MTAKRMFWVSAIAISIWPACGGGSSSGSGGSSSAGDCGADEVEVHTFAGGEDASVCKPIPSACSGKASCSDQACVAALYDLCQAPAIGAGCSDTVPPTIVSCNE